MNKVKLYFIILGSFLSGIILINIIRCYICNYSKKITVQELPKPKKVFNTIPDEWVVYQV